MVMNRKSEGKLWVNEIDDLCMNKRENKCRKLCIELERMNILSSSNHHSKNLYS